MYSKMAYFQQGYELLRELEPSLHELMQALVQQRKEYLSEMTQLDVTELLATKMLHQTASNEKQGYLSMKIKGHWKRRWFVVADGKLHFYKNWKELNPIRSHDLLLASVKEETNKEDPKNSPLFGIQFPSEALSLQAISFEDRDEWLKVLRNSIAFRLKKANQSNNASTVQRRMTSKAYGQLRMISDENCYCADCNRKDPDWASINLGTLICYECSGIHRSLGVHISRVRSLTLDDWEPELLMLMKTIGNAKANSIWEFNVSQSLKPSASSDRETRDRYIRAKYQLKRFIERPTPELSKNLNKYLYEATMENDLLGVYKLIAQGAEVNVKDENTGRALIHHAVIEGATNLFCLELLIQSGAKVYETDIHGRTALHYAAKLDRTGHAKLLIARGGDITIKDDEGHTAVEMASVAHSKEFLQLVGDMNEAAKEKIARQQPNAARETSSSKDGIKISSPMSLARQKEHLVEERKLNELQESLSEDLTTMRKHLNTLHKETSKDSNPDSLLATAKRLRAVRMVLFHTNPNEEKKKVKVEEKKEEKQEEETEIKKVRKHKRKKSRKDKRKVKKKRKQKQAKREGKENGSNSASDLSVASDADSEASGIVRASGDVGESSDSDHVLPPDLKIDIAAAKLKFKSKKSDKSCSARRKKKDSIAENGEEQTDPKTPPKKEKKPHCGRKKTNKKKATFKD
eukprot:TRINITY_DN1224_c0_g2_i1.p1 TRINITY_DN1224_c0_g2~~TRINITY_DN1224_c0_g2_i1.p1  ORF type:complete len:690 (+),score=160.69 TRINITY_DN1224_c0_g2_i1:269-2338(+)